MKCAIYGISCAGKDTMIETLLKCKELEKFEHPKGSESLKAIAMRTFGRVFKSLSDDEKNDVRRLYIESISHIENMLADGHYGFPREGTFDVVMTESDAQFYDAFFYLKGNPEVIKERIGRSEKNAKFASLTVDDIAEWQNREIRELRDVCFEHGKDFIILDSNMDEACKFVCRYVENYGSMDSYSQAQSIANLILAKADGYRKIALFDCDRTIVEEDTGTDYFKVNGASLAPVKEIFADDSYSLYQFFRYRQLQEGFSAVPAIDLFHMTPVVQVKMAELRREGFFIVGITSGVGEIWNRLNDERHFADMIVSDDSLQGLVIADLVKGYVSRILSHTCEVFACGDSMTDIYMLESASYAGVIHAPGKIRKSVQNYLLTHKDTRIRQFDENPVQYQIGLV